MIGVVVAEGEIVDGEAGPGKVGGDSTAQLIRQAREAGEPVDYRRYSKVLNPQVRRYAFGFEQLLR